MAENTVQTMSLEEYKKKVEECLMKTQNCSIQETRRLMKTYEAYFQEFLEEEWNPSVAAGAMVMGA